MTFGYFSPLATRDPKVPQTIHDEAKAVLGSLEGIGDVRLEFDIQDPPSAQGGAAAVGKSSIPGVKKVIAISSGKGGVGEVHRGIEPRYRPLQERGQGRPLRLRPLWPQHLLDVRHQRPPGGDRRQRDHSHRSTRHQADVDGLPS